MVQQGKFGVIPNDYMDAEGRAMQEQLQSSHLVKEVFRQI